MTALKKRIARLIQKVGPISVSEYFTTCLFDYADGYYTTREPFGTAGDFVTAPDISQIFGELVAVWLYAVWDAMGRPETVTVAEIGPGRGTLMADMLHTWAQFDTPFGVDAQFAMIEVSPRLVEVQKRTLADPPVRITWHQTIDTLPDAPLLIVGNELFDAVPIRQYVQTGHGWRERMVALDDRGKLCLAAGQASLDPDLLPPGAAAAPPGTIVEVAPARSALMSQIAQRIARHGGAGLFFDYGYFEPAVGDTLQAVRRHRYVDVLTSPGRADLTAHVDFAALAGAARAAGLDAHIATQGSFLLGMGILERAGQLGANADAKERERIGDAVERLAAPDAMGKLFKVLAVVPAGADLPPFPYPERL